jgi:hypothetical protein
MLASSLGLGVGREGSSTGGKGSRKVVGEQREMEMAMSGRAKHAAAQMAAGGQ